MSDVPELLTPRLILRAWRAEDREPFADMNADPLVRRYFPTRLSRAESDALIDWHEASFAQHGFGCWAVDVREPAAFIGFLGLSIPSFEAHFTPCVEIGWRLAAPYWNQGYATEGARAVLAFGFEQLNLAEIVSFTAAINMPSRRVMEKLGMTHDPADDFDHPKIPEPHPLRPHVLYRVCRRRPTLQSAS